MCPCEYTAVCSLPADQPRSRSWMEVAKNGLPVSTSTRPSPVAKALTLAKDRTNDTPSATSVTLVSGKN